MKLCSLDGLTLDTAKNSMQQFLSSFCVFIVVLMICVRTGTVQYSYSTVPIGFVFSNIRQTYPFSNALLIESTNFLVSMVVTGEEKGQTQWHQFIFVFLHPTLGNLLLLLVKVVVFQYVILHQTHILPSLPGIILDNRATAAGFRCTDHRRVFPQIIQFTVGERPSISTKTASSVVCSVGWVGHSVLHHPLAILCSRDKVHHVGRGCICRLERATTRQQQQFARRSTTLVQGPSPRTESEQNASRRSQSRKVQTIRQMARAYISPYSWFHHGRANSGCRWWQGRTCRAFMHVQRSNRCHGRSKTSRYCRLFCKCCSQGFTEKVARTICRTSHGTTQLFKRNVARTIHAACHVF
jgi:hypothetical protein